MSNSYEESFSRGRTISLRKYNAIIGIVLFYGFAMNAVMVKYFAEYFSGLPAGAVIVGYFVTAIIGILMSKLSDNSFVSFIGYNLVVIPVGVILAITIHVEGFSAAQIIHAAGLTAFFTVAMMIGSMIWSNFFLKLGRVLFFGLTAIIVVEVVCLVTGIFLPTIWDILVAAVFCGYVGYDWVKAQEDLHTTDNAIDACVGLYLDIINIFIRLLSASSSSSKSSRRN